MHATSALLALAATASAATIQGFNYGSTNPDGSFASQQDFQNQFAAAKQLPGTNGGFTSARLYTTIQGGTTNTFTEAIPAAIATKTRLLLGMWASSGDATISDEIAALQAAISKYGSQFTDLVDGISVGSEDLYRITATAMSFDPQSVGTGPNNLVDYIKQLRNAISGTSLSGASIGHVDTWTAWVNSSNSAVVDACDWIGMDAYPYFQSQMDNSINNGESLFDSAWKQTQSAAKGKPVWVTETGWPLSGKTVGAAVPSTSNAQQYWEAVGCGQLFGKVNTYWYTYFDGTPNPSFGLVPSVGGSPKFDLSCSQKPTISMGSSVMASATGAGSTSPTQGSGSSGSGSGSGNSTVSPASPTSGGSGSGTGSGTSSSSTSNPAHGAAGNVVVNLFGLLGAAVAAVVAF